MATTATPRRRTVGDDPALAARLRTGDPAAFEDLYLLTELPRAVPPG
jgi:hypothetical protein